MRKIIVVGSLLLLISGVRTGGEDGADLIATPAFAKDKESKEERKQDQKAGRRVDKVVSFSFNQSGGFMGMDRSYQAKLADLDATEREKLEGLIKDSGLLNVKNEDKRTQGAADMFFYQFAAEEKNQTHKATFDDGTLPKSYRPLIDYLKDKMVDNRKRGQ